MTIARKFVFITLIGLLVGPLLGVEGKPPAVLDALFGEERRIVALEALETRALLGPGENQRVVEIGRDAHTSHHVVSIRDRETPHRHDRHDLTVVLLGGWGTMQIGDEERRVGQGSIIYVPRGTPHAFRNLSDTPAVAYAVYTPPFDGKDRVVEE
jgi:mannose-6-phosphate isomerase-like protein (cupin superfamily)